MPTITTVDATWTNAMTMDEAELRRADTTMFLGDGSANGVRGGVVRHGDTSLAVSVNGSDQVTVQPGAAVIPAATGLGAYRTSLASATAAVGLASRNATNPRIDLIVIQIVSGAAVVRTVDGTPGSSPTAPALPASSIELARVTVPAVGGGAVTVDSTWRAYATALGGTLHVETAARLPGSGNQRGQRAVSLSDGKEYTWNGTAWQESGPATGWVTAYEGPDTYNSAAPTTAAVIPGGGPHNVTVPAGRTLDIHLQIPRLELNGIGGVQVWITAGNTRGGYWDNPSGSGINTSVELNHSVLGTGANVAINVFAFKLGTNGGAIRGIAGQQGPRIKYRIT